MIQVSNRFYIWLSATRWKENIIEGGVYQHISKPTGINHSSIKGLKPLIFIWRPLDTLILGADYLAMFWKIGSWFNSKRNWIKGGNCCFSGIFVLQTFVVRGKIRRSQQQYFLSHFFIISILCLFFVIMKSFILNCNSLGHCQSLNQLSIL